MTRSERGQQLHRRPGSVAKKQRRTKQKQERSKKHGYMGGQFGGLSGEARQELGLNDHQRGNHQLQTRESNELKAGKQEKAQ